MLVRNPRTSPGPTHFTPQCYYSSPTKTSVGTAKIPIDSPENPSRLAALRRLRNVNVPRVQSGQFKGTMPPHDQPWHETQGAGNLFSSALFMPIYSSRRDHSRSSSVTDEGGSYAPSSLSTVLPVQEVLYSSSAGTSSSDSLIHPASIDSYDRSSSSLSANLQQLRIDVGGIQGYLNWDSLKYDVVDPFFRDGTRSHSNSLLIDWNSSRADPHGWRAINLMKDLFHQLGYRVLVSGTPQIALSTFTSFSISIPDVAIPQNQDPSRQIAFDSLAIQLDEARSLREFNWQGDLYVLATIFRGVPSTSLTILSLTRCQITVFDAVSLLHACPRLIKATLETIAATEACPGGNLMTPSSRPVAHFQSLTDLSVRSFVSLMFFFERTDFPRLQSLDFDLDRIAAQDVDRLPIAWSGLRKLRLHCGLTESQYARLQSLSPRLKFKVTKTQ
ncbi:hypothetical protein CVT24_011063 [Panaeolus cyanescens]|uniref:F-box domain-containing protein n=1 Tax=Panaeolus cyanescens TaxID=181874 RepID=A0A409VG30_9AGAR|nr:hypothetical protein CVT24_011063 [Panaeolus cyanescens]